MVFMQTERLILRNVSEKDVAIMYDYRNNERCARFQRGQTKDLAGITALIDKRKNDVITDTENFILAVALKQTDELIGEIVVMPNDGAITIGYTFSYRYHRMGYAYEALSALIELLHGRYPQMEFICFTDKDNTASMALLKKLGYEDLGYVDKITSQVFGKWVKNGI